MRIRKVLAAASSCAVLALFAIGAEAQNKPKLDANGMPCNGELDGALQCFKPEATVNTPEIPQIHAVRGSRHYRYREKAGDGAAGYRLHPHA